jgi:hypothetical protein
MKIRSKIYFLCYCQDTDLFVKYLFQFQLQFPAMKVRCNNFIFLVKKIIGRKVLYIEDFCIFWIFGIIFPCADPW